MRIPSLLLLTIFPLVSSANQALDRLENSDLKDELITNNVPENFTTFSAREWKEMEWPSSPLKSIWDKAKIYENPQSSFIQSVELTGHFDWQISTGAAEVEFSNSQTEQRLGIHENLTRRARLGARIQALNHTNFEFAGEFAGDSSYNGLERLFVETEVNDHLSVRVGKFRPTFSQDYIDDPQSSPYPDRNVLTNMLVPNRVMGAKTAFRHGDSDYALAWFSNDTDKWLPDFNSHGLIVANLARNFIENSGNSSRKSKWTLDYMFNLDDRDSEVIPSYRKYSSVSANGAQPITDPNFRHFIHTGISLEDNRMGFDAGFSLATTSSKVYGLNLSPTYWLIPGYVRLVGRYQYAESDEGGGIITAIGPATDPFRVNSPLFTGNTLHAFYLGANFHVFEDKLVITSGVEHTLLDNSQSNLEIHTEAWIWQTGVRLSF